MNNNTKKDESEIQSDKEPEADEKTFDLPKCDPKGLG